MRPNPFAQVDLFDRPPPRSGKSARPYQTILVSAVEEKFAAGADSVLAVMATGLGKTYCAAEIAERAKGRVLFTAHLDTLVSQSLVELQEMTGQVWEREQGPDHATRNGTRNVVASIATLMQPHRLSSFAPGAFDRVIVDEAHHYLSAKYFEAISYFKAGGAKIVGLTATPDRKDGKAMGRLFSTVAVDPPFDIGFGVDEAWLSPIEWRPIETDVDLDAVPVVKSGANRGDFDQERLDEEIARIIAPIVKVAIEKVGERRTIVFTPGVKAAYAAAEALNALRPGCARAIDGTRMERDEKREIIARHKAGEFQFLINCGVLVEGYDDAQVICMIDAAPTKSRSRSAQKVGRITRPWPGTTPSDSEREERAASIAASPKPFAVWIDLAFNGTKHKLETPVDILGGKYTDKERAKAKKILAKEGGGDVKGALDKARAQIAAAANRARVRMQERGALNPLKQKAEPIDPKGPPSAGELRRLSEFGVPTEGLTHEEAHSILKKEFLAKRMGWCSWKERESIQRNIGANTWGMKRETAKRMVRGWRWAGRPKEPTPWQIAEWSNGRTGDPGPSSEP